MLFSKSDFLFIYNIPNDVNVHELAKDVPYLSSFKSINCNNDVKAAFALVDTTECISDNLAEERSETVQAHFKAKNVCVDLVWFKVASSDTSDPPFNDIVASSFLFLYNFPGDVSDLTLQAMTGVKNFVCLFASDGTNKCAFLELMHLSDSEFHQLKSIIPQQSIPGFHDCFFSVDEVWLQPSYTKMQIDVVSDKIAIDPDLKQKLDTMNDEEITQLLHTLSDKQNLLSNHLGTNNPKFVELSSKIKSIALYFAERTSYSLANICENENVKSSIVHSSSSNKSQLQPSITQPAAGQTTGPPSASTIRMPSVPAFQGSGVHPSLPAAELPVSQSGLSAPILPTPPGPQIPVFPPSRMTAPLLPSPSRQQASILPSPSGPQTSNLPPPSGPQTPVYPSRTPAPILPPPGPQTPVYPSRTPAPILPPPSGPQTPVYPSRIPAPILPSPSGPQTPVYPSRTPAPILPPPAGPQTPILPSLSEPQTPVTPSQTPVSSSGPQTQIQKNTSSKYKKSSFIFVPNLSADIPINEIPAKIPGIERFVILERPDKDHVAGFIFLRNTSAETRINACKSLQAWQIKLTGGYDPLNMDRVCLEGNLIKNLRSKYISTKASKGLDDEEKCEKETFRPDSHISSKKHRFSSPKSTSVSIGLEEKMFLQSSGNNVNNIPIFRCVFLDNLPSNISDTQITKQTHSGLVFAVLRTETASRRLLCFGGSESEAKVLCRKIADRISGCQKASVQICNRLEYLAPIENDLAERAKCRRLLLINLPNWHPNLLKQRIAYFAPNVTACWFPVNKSGLSLGHGYLGYSKFTDCKEDYKRLSDWRITSDFVVRVFYAADSGWGNDCPLNDPCESIIMYRSINSKEIARIRGDAAKDEEANATQYGDSLSSIRPYCRLPTDLHDVLARHCYSSPGEVMQALIIKPLSKDITAAAANLFIEAKIKCVQSYDIQLTEKGTEKVLTLFFGAKASKEYDVASSKIRLLYQSKDSQLENLIISSEKLVIERQRPNDFTPVSAEFALARGCQFLELFDLPIGEGWSRGTYQEILRTLFPGARSFYVPVSNVRNMEIVRGCAYVRFDDPRKCREAYQSMAPRCRYGNNREARVTYAALHMTINLNYMNQRFACPLHNCFQWMHYDVNKEPFPWTTDTGFRKPFFCTCHLGCLPFKE